MARSARGRTAFANLWPDARFQEPYGVSYEVEVGSERLAPGPGVVGRLAFVGEAPGPVAIPALWTVTKAEDLGDVPDPYCTGSENIPVTLRKPTPTSLVAERRKRRSGASRAEELASSVLPRR